MYGSALRKITRWACERLNRGDIRPILALFARNATYRYHGEHSWAADFGSRAELEPWLRRFVDVGIQFHPDEIMVVGAPWNSRVVLVYNDDLTDDDGEVIYVNRGVHVMRVRWGRIISDEVFSDSQLVAALDDRLGNGSGRTQKFDAPEAAGRFSEGSSTARR